MAKKRTTKPLARKPDPKRSTPPRPKNAPSSQWVEVEARLEERFAAGVLPHGAMAQIAREVGCSREYVRQCANAIGFTERISRVQVQLCEICNQPLSRQNRSGIHQHCRSVELPCAWCGAPVRRLRSKQASQARNRPTIDGVVVPFTGRVFCNYTCVGAYAGTHYGWGVHTDRSYKRKTHCQRGHPLSGANLYLDSDGGRHCRACRKIHSAAWAARRRRMRHTTTT